MGDEKLTGKDINEINIGESARFTKTVSEADVYLFAGITGDVNPAHLNEEYAKNTFFKKRIAHGMLTGSLISTVIGTLLPGPGTIYLKQELNFLAPVFFGDTITAEVSVADKDTSTNRLRLKTSCTNQAGVLVVTGLAVVSPPKVKIQAKTG